MEWKELKNAIQQTEIKVEELGEKLDELPELKDKLREKNDEVFNSNKLIHQLAGMLMSLGDTVKGLKIELHNDKYRHIEKTILDLNVKFCLTRDIATEVQEKHDALETALMKYHHEKMKDINQTLADMWKLTYKGRDIEAIEIKSDADKTANNARIRSYNYRIVLKTHDDTELDMRGRCSAG